LKEGEMPRRASGQPPLLHAHTAAKLRAEYRKQWGQDWPHDDRYLKQLWDEAARQADRLQQRHRLVQIAMRECDTTIPESYGAPPADGAAAAQRQEPGAGGGDV
jgi:hypothetical protein